jgi:hypothetical protein
MEFKTRFLLVRVTPGERGLQFNPVFDCINSETCLATDGCGYCSGDCTNCTETCHGDNSLGAFLPDPEGEIEVVMNIETLREVVRKAERWGG